MNGAERGSRSPRRRRGPRFEPALRRHKVEMAYVPMHDAVLLRLRVGRRPEVVGEVEVLSYPSMLGLN